MKHYMYLLLGLVLAPAMSFASIGETYEPYVATYKSLVRTLGDGGSQVRVAKDGDSLVIADLVLANAVIKGKINGKKLSIPNWYSVGRIDGVGNIAFVALKMQDNIIFVDSTATAITGSIAGDQKIMLNGMFGLFTTETETASYYYVGKECVIQKGNATMTMNYYGTDVSFAIIAQQHDGVMTLTNFGNTGLTFDAPLTADREIAIGGGKFARIKPAASVLDFMAVGVNRYTTNADGTYKPIVYNSSLKAIADGDRAVTWGMWCGTNSSGAYVVGPYMNGRIDFTEDVVYPSAPELTGLAGAGTEDAPYVISTTDDWLTVAANVAAGNTHLGHHFKVASDLDFTGMDFAPIGEAIGMRGTIDGQMHTITVNDDKATSPRGLIGRLGDDGVVRNLNTAGSFDFGTSTNVGGIVGLTGQNVLIENCINHASITASGQGIGGVLGHGNSGTVVRNCKNMGTIHYTGDNSSIWLAGVVGYAANMSLYDCGNEGQFVIDKPTVAGCIGGVLSYTIFMDEVVNCYNTADINAGQYISGVQAYCAQTGLGWTLYKGCYNTGNITSTIKETNIPFGGVFTHVIAGSQVIDCWNSGNIKTVGCNAAGGVIGHYLGASGDNIERALLVKRCYNTGNVTTTASANMIVGGVMGFGNVVALDSCWNSGTVTNANYTCGGIIGQIQNHSTMSYITNCYNLGNVKGGNWVGGIVGNAAFDQPIDNCWNAGTITAKNRFGGIIGYSANGAKINRCFNVGEIVSTNTAVNLGATGAHTIGGIAGDFAGDITNSYNAGGIRGMVRVGGIMGSPYRTASQDNSKYIVHLDGCYNVGEFTRMRADSCGHIVGVHMQNNGSVWRKGIDTLENCHYLNTVNSKAIVEADADQHGHSTAELCLTDISDNYVSPGNYCYPILTTQTENPYALLYAVAVVPAEADAKDNTITTNFHVGTPQGVTWTSSYSGLTVEGNDAVFTDDAYEGKVTLTAAIDPAGFSKSTEAAGEPLTRKFVLQVKKPFTDAINDVKADKQVKAVRYYNMQGVQVMHPESHNGILIQVNDYTDGTRSSHSVVK